MYCGCFPAAQTHWRTSSWGWRRACRRSPRSGWGRPGGRRWPCCTQESPAADHDLHLGTLGNAGQQNIFIQTNLQGDRGGLAQTLIRCQYGCYIGPESSICQTTKVTLYNGVPWARAPVWVEEFLVCHCLNNSASDDGNLEHQNQNQHNPWAYWTPCTCIHLIEIWLPFRAAPGKYTYTNCNRCPNR